MSNSIKIECDPFWQINSKLSTEEIEKRFPTKIAEALKIQKEIKVETEK